MSDRANRYWTPERREEWSARMKAWWQREGVYQYRSRFPLLAAAYDRLQEDMASGRIVQQPCDVCGGESRPFFLLGTYELCGWRCHPCRKTRPVGQSPWQQRKRKPRAPKPRARRVKASRPERDTTSRRVLLFVQEHPGCRVKDVALQIRGSAQRNAVESTRTEIGRHIKSGLLWVDTDKRCWPRSLAAAGRVGQ